MLPRSATPAPHGLLGRDDAEDGLSVCARRPASERKRDERIRGIVREHFVSVWRFVRRLGFEPHFVDDAVQDLFLVLLRRVDDIVPGQERTFLFSAAIRIAKKMSGKGARETPVEDLPSRPEPVAATPETLLDEERSRRLLMQLLSELEERRRVVFVLYEIEEMTVPEIAEVLDLPAGTVASRLRAARDDFRARLARHRARTEREVGK